MNARTKNAIDVAKQEYDPSNYSVSPDDEYERFKAISAGIPQIVNRVIDKHRASFRIEFFHTADLDREELMSRINPLLAEYDVTGTLNPTGTISDGEFNKWELVLDI